MTKIYKWEEISDHFDGTLLLGNGASIAIYSGFAYRSLYEAAVEEALLSPAMEKLFEYLGDTDFERVLELLWHAIHVNRALEIEDKVIASAYQDIRHALITIIQKTHAEYALIEAALSEAAAFMQDFRTVLSLNYDLIVYWAMMLGNERLGGSWFKDCFIYDGKKFEHDYEWLRKALPPATDATLVFYPHGNLILANSFYGGEEKLRREEEHEDLLDAVVATWVSEDYVPVFVSEGTSKQKRAAILRSEYLSAVYNNVLPKALREKPVLYGWSMNPQDQHVVEQLAAAEPEQLAVSVNLRGKNDEEIEKTVAAIEKRVKEILPDTKLVLFDAASPGCWIH